MRGVRGVWGVEGGMGEEDEGGEGVWGGEDEGGEGGVWGARSPG